MTQFCSLGTSVDQILVEWHQITEKFPGHVRALITTGGEITHALFCWRQGKIYKILPTGEYKEASTEEVKWLRECLTHGFTLIFWNLSGHEPVVFHERGILVPQEGNQGEGHQELPSIQRPLPPCLPCPSPVTRAAPAAPISFGARLWLGVRLFLAGGLFLTRHFLAGSALLLTTLSPGWLGRQRLHSRTEQGRELPSPLQGGPAQG